MEKLFKAYVETRFLSDVLYLWMDEWVLLI